MFMDCCFPIVPAQDSLERILTAKRSTDVLAAVRAKKAARRGPFVVVFIGVNGVGKSTSLAKVCSFLKRNGHSVLIAACDTFRSGAVEQLRTHCDALEVDLFARGWCASGILGWCVLLTVCTHACVLQDTTRIRQ